MVNEVSAVRNGKCFRTPLFRRNLKDEELEKLGKLFKTVSGGALLAISETRSFGWKAVMAGSLTRGYDLMYLNECKQQNIQEWMLHQVVWKAKSPLKYKVCEIKCEFWIWPVTL